MTSTQTSTRDQAVTAAIREISHIATLPEITVKIIELVEDPGSTAQDLNNVISNDPALCSRILKVVNSSFYGLPGQIGSINRAIVLLGLNAVKNIAISASLAKLFRGGELGPKFAAKDLWKHSITTAAASKIIADTLKLGLPDEAFLAGLMHDIGIMVAMQHDRQKLIEVFNRVEIDASGAPSSELREIELAVFGADHQDFGRGLSEKWKFPKAITHVTGHHHNPLDLPSGSRTLACLVHVADRIAGDTPEAFRLDLPSLEPAPGVLEELRLTAEQLAAVREQVGSNLADVEALLG